MSVMLQIERGRNQSRLLLVPTKILHINKHMHRGSNINTGKSFKVNNMDTTTMDKIFETNSSFHVKQRTKRKVQFLFYFSMRFFLVLTKI